MKKSLILSCLLLTAACTRDPSTIVTSINIIDRNGTSETISGSDRLANYEKTDFLASQPYQKVVRVFGKNKSGEVTAKITSYHPNGQIKQYLEAQNGRAKGIYREWYANGQKKVEAILIGGAADLDTESEKSWLFDQTSFAWNENGQLIAKIPYVKGELEGIAEYFHENGQLWKQNPHKNGLLEGTQKIFLQDGSLFMTTDYEKGKKHGTAVRYWDLSHIAYHEKYVEGKLLEASYYDQLGKTLATIKGGFGKRAVFNKQNLDRLESFADGVQEGSVTVFDDGGRLIRTYCMHAGEKSGEEIDYFPGTEKPKLLLSWKDGLLQGTVKSWYANGQLESQKEMSCNKKCGLLSAWYENGAVMLLEEYDNDNLVKGEYFRAGEASPISRVENGSGMATLFSADGNLSHRICYENGKPLN